MFSIGILRAIARALALFAFFALLLSCIPEYVWWLAYVRELVPFYLLLAVVTLPAFLSFTYSLSAVLKWAMRTLMVLVLLRFVVILAPFFNARSEYNTANGTKFSALFMDEGAELSDAEQALVSPSLVIRKGGEELAAPSAAALGHKLSVGEASEAITLLSAWPLELLETDLGEGLPPMLLAKVSHPQQVFQIALSAAPPIRDYDSFKSYKLILRRFASKVRFHEIPTLIYVEGLRGPYSEYYRRYIEWLDLRDLRWGAGTFGVFRPWRWSLLKADLPLVSRSQVFASEQFEGSGILLDGKGMSVAQLLIKARED